MTLTPEDVRKKTFTPVRLREGYDMGEVDQFLDEVEVELTRLHAENDDLRATSAGPSAATSVSAPTRSDSGAPSDTDAAAISAKPVVTTVAEASGAAARLLEIAAHNADQLVAEAHGDADKIVGEATVKAERLESESKAAAERLEAESQSRSERLGTEMSQRREQQLGALERDKDNLARELEDLRAFEREYRSRLRAYFQSQLRALDGQADGSAHIVPSGDAATPDAATPAAATPDAAPPDGGPARGLRDILEEDPQQ